MTDCNRQALMESTGTTDVYEIPSYEQNFQQRPKTLSSFLECQTKEDRIIRNLWFVFVIGVFAFLSILLVFRGELFESDLPIHHHLWINHL